MYKTIKIPEQAYEEAKLLSKELEKSKAIIGVFNVSLSTAISYAIAKMLETIRKSKKIITKPIDNDLKELFKEAKNTKPKYKFTPKQMDKLIEDGLFR